MTLCGLNVNYWYFSGTREEERQEHTVILTYRLSRPRDPLREKHTPNTDPYFICVCESRATKQRYGVLFPNKVIPEVLRLKVGIRSQGWGHLVRKLAMRSNFLLLLPQGAVHTIFGQVQQAQRVLQTALCRYPYCTGGTPQSLVQHSMLQQEAVQEICLEGNFM